MKIAARVAAVLMIAAFCIGPFANVAHAAFDKNRLIDDGVFNSVGTMSANDIDAFLNARNSCISPNSGFRAIDPTGYSSSTGFQYGGNVTAGTIIAHAAQAYDLNPRVLLVTLQKEQSLITTTPTDSNCNTRTISKSMGYACTDTYSPHSYSGLNLYTRNGTTYTSVDLTCVESAQKAGFTQQVIRAAWLFKFTQQRSLGNINWAIIRGSWDNSDDLQSCYSGPVTQGWRQVCPSGPTTYYDGYTTIDGLSVHPESGATEALYRYTPHFSGNQNFVAIWASWFGGTIVNFEPMQTPRWLQLKNDNVFKKNLATGENTEGPFPKGMQLFITSKIELNGVVYYRTAHDSSGNLFQGIQASDMEGTPYQPMAVPRWMKLTSDAYKQVPCAEKNVDGILSAGRSIYFNSKIEVNGITYLRTAHDTDGALDKGIPMSLLTDVDYKTMVAPRWMHTTRDIYKVNPRTGLTSGSVIPAGTQIRFNNKITLAENTFLRAEDDTTSAAELGININDLEDNHFEDMVIPRVMTVNKNTTKYNVLSLDAIDCPLVPGQKIEFRSKIFVKDQWYLRTKVDTGAYAPYAVPLADLNG